MIVLMDSQNQVQHTTTASNTFWLTYNQSGNGCLGGGGITQ